LPGGFDARYFDNESFEVEDPSPHDIVDKIIALLTAADPKNIDGKSVVRWFVGQPPKSRWPGFPFGWVEWAGDQLKPPTIKLQEIQDRYYIVVIDKHAVETKAEDSIMDFAATIRDVILANPTLDSKVSFAYVEKREREKQWEGESSVVALRVTIYTRRKE
jgi:hypothetical protein